jgi:hypothetical protein
MIRQAIERFLIKRELNHDLKLRRIARELRSEASLRGVSTDWHRRAARTREVFGERV